MPYSRQDILTQNINTYPNNNSGQITPDSVKTFNQNWIDSVVFTDQTGSLVVTSASYAANAGNANTATTATTATSASFASTASFVLGSIESASFASTSSWSAYAVTASYALNVSTVDTGSLVTTASFNAYTGSTNAFTASMKTFTGSIQTQVNALQAATSSYVRNAQTASMSVLSASFADTANNVRNGLNITASNITVLNNLTVNGTASFAYTKTTTGSAVVIGDEFIILNADTPTAPYAGIMVYDTGSNSTASFEWNGNSDYWITVEESGASAGILTGASGSKGSEVFPSLNRLTKGTGNNTIVNSNITDTGTLVSIGSNASVTGSLNISQTAIIANSASIGGVQFGVGPGTQQYNIAIGTQALQSNSNSNSNIAIGTAALFANTTGEHNTAIGRYAGLDLITGSRNTLIGSNPSAYAASTTGNDNVIIGYNISNTGNKNNNILIGNSFDAGNISQSIQLATAGVVRYKFDGTKHIFNGGISGSNGFTGSLLSNEIQATNVAGLDIKNNTGGLVAIFGAGGSTGATIYGQVNATAFSGSGALVTGVISSSYAATASFISGQIPSASYAATASYVNTLNQDVTISGSLGVTGTSTLGFVTIVDDGAINFNTTASATHSSWGIATNPTNGDLVINSNPGNLKPISFNDSDLYIRMYEGVILEDGFNDLNTNTQALVLTSSIAATVNLLDSRGTVLIKPKSMDTISYPYTINQASDDNATGGNLIISRNATSTNATGSINISGSNNIGLFSLGATNASISAGSGSGFEGRNSIVTVAPVLSGTNGTGYDKAPPTFVNSIINAIPTIVDNRTSETDSPIVFSTVSSNSTLTYTVSTGSATLANSNMTGLLNQIRITGSNSSPKSITSLNIFGNSNTASIESPTGAGSFTGVLVAGNLNTVYVTGSLTTLQAAAVVGYGLALTGSAAGTTNYGSVVVGRFNNSGSLSSQTAFEVGTGTSNTARRTSLHVSSSGLTTISNLSATGNLNGTASYVGPTLTQNLILSGSVNGEVKPLTITSETASMDCNTANFFTLTLVSGSTTFLNPTNIAPGDTINLRVIQSSVASGSLSFAGSVKQPLGSTYVPTSATGSAVDILTFISFDNSNLYLSSVKNLV